MNAPWWRDAVVYEVYPRSFADGDGDGVGDLAGLRSRLPYLRDLGVDAVWVAPWYPSPGVDGGYDVSDYRDVAPDLGTLADAEALVADAHAVGIRVVIDLVANHTSAQHPWFVAALAAAPGSVERSRYLFRDGRGARGQEPPNDWISAFGSSAWTRVADGQWYQHTFAPEQPDLDWSNPAVRAEFADVLRFWFDRGVDGVRADAVPAMAKVAGLPAAGYDPALGFRSAEWTDAPHWDTPGVHELMREWRAVAEEYGPDRFFLAEAVVSSPRRLADYLRPDELHAAFNFDVLRAGWDAGRLRTAVDATFATLAPVGAPATWVWSSHDETRHVTRFGRQDTSAAVMGFDADLTADLALGTRRARAAALLQLALPGIACLYQGDELGLPEVVDLPVSALRDPIWERSGRTSRGRDGCRVPLPWSGDEPPYGFTAGVGPTWLPQPVGWGPSTVAAQEHDERSMLALYRRALRLRRALAAGRADGFGWLDAPHGVLAFRTSALTCWVNLSSSAVPLPAGSAVLLASDPDGPAGLLPADAAVWLPAT